MDKNDQKHEQNQLINEKKKNLLNNINNKIEMEDINLSNDSSINPACDSSSQYEL